MVEIEENASHKVDVDDQQPGVSDAESRLLHSASKGTTDPKKGLKKKNEKSEQDRRMTKEINKFLRDNPLTDDVTCGFWVFKGKLFQKFANQTSYVIIYGLVGCILSVTYSYFNGTITTIEKRFKIPSKNTGLISVGYDISHVMVSGLLTYYAGKGHRPRWMGFGLLTLVAYCMLTAAPHFLYGPGEDALTLTKEFGAIPDENSTIDVMEEQRSKTLCRLRGDAACVSSEVEFAPQVVFFSAQFISGIGGSLYNSLGVSYMDDNSKKSKTPALITLSYLLVMLGPATGYALASVCLRVYIAPQLHPLIKIEDPRWLGAWWMGWLIIGPMIMASGILLAMFPKELPRAAARRMVDAELRKQRHSIQETNEEENHNSIDQVEGKASAEQNASFMDMVRTFRRLTTNKTFMCIILSGVFFFFGSSPYWIFIPKYIEIQYRQSASTSGMVMGTVTIPFSAVGVILSGFVISRYKPSARKMAAWNIITSLLTVAGIITYAFIGCPGNEQSIEVNIYDKATNNTETCNSSCGCDYVSYSPVCGENNMTYISPCHAGCKQQYTTKTGIKYFYDCSCIPYGNSTFNGNPTFERLTNMDLTVDDDLSSVSTPNLDLLLNGSGQAVSGACPVNCFTQFVTFLVVMCALGFIGATTTTSNFLLFVRCVPETDKTAAIGFSMMMMSILAAIPSPIFFGWLLDRLCLVWGKTCTSTGNCWLYDVESLRYTLNITAAVFMLIGGLFDCGIWYHVKDLKIFDDEIKDVELDSEKEDEEGEGEKTKM